MPPKLRSKNFPGMELIRPLYCVHEDAIIAWKNYNHLRFLQCACRFTEARDAAGDGVGESKRQEMKALLRELKKTNPNIEKSMFRAVHGVQLDTFPGFKFRGRTFPFREVYGLPGLPGPARTRRTDGEEGDVSMNYYRCDNPDCGYLAETEPDVCPRCGGTFFQPVDEEELTGSDWVQLGNRAVDEDRNTDALACYQRAAAMEDVLGLTNLGWCLEAAWAWRRTPGRRWCCMPRRRPGTTCRP